jgi:hypothetical protein
MKRNFVAILVSTLMLLGVCFVQAAKAQKPAKGILTLRIHQVYCQDETGGKYQEKIGKDDIFMANAVDLRIGKGYNQA